MRNWIKKNWLTGLIVAVVVTTAYAATKFTSLTVTNNANVGTLTLATATTITGSTPTVVDVMTRDSTYRVWISTCITDFGCWQKVGAQ
ncbi:MAG: hypothetical protein UMS36scaffold28_12 [Phage 59_13]|nr:MAG: hypothetical protein UMS36scaffold28_12 [Phage 59_13]